MGYLERLMVKQEKLSLEEIDESVPIDNNTSSAIQETDEVEEIVQINNTLETYDRIISEADNVGGLRPVEGRIISAAVEHFQQRLGIPTDVPSLEDFQKPYGPIVATEDLKTKVKDGIIAAYRKLREMILKLIQSIKDKARSLRNKDTFSDKDSLEALNTINFDVYLGIGEVNSLDEYAANIDTALDYFIKAAETYAVVISKLNRSLKANDVETSKQTVSGLGIVANDDITGGAGQNKFWTPGLNGEYKYASTIRTIPRDNPNKKIKVNKNTIAKTRTALVNINKKYIKAINEIQFALNLSKDIGSQFERVSREAGPEEDLTEHKAIVFETTTYIASVYKACTRLIESFDSIIDVLKIKITQTDLDNDEE